MAQRRMFSPKIVSSDAFLDMPTSSRELYFQLGMYADDDGFINPRTIMRMIGASDDDLKVLIGKRFVIPFENGVVVIKHWKINNLIRKDFYQETLYLEQKNLLETKENGAYTEYVTEKLPTRSRRLGKVRLGKVNTVDTPLQVLDQFKSNSLWEKIIKKYPDRDYQLEFEKMIDWWQTNKKKLPKSISSWDNWLSKSSVDKRLQSERLHELEMAENKRKQEELDSLPPVKPETIEKARQLLDQAHSSIKSIN